MPEPKFHQKIAWFNFICCLMVIWTHSGNADLFFPELGQDAPWWHFQYPVMQEILRVDIPCFIMLSAYLFYRNFTMKRARVCMAGPFLRDAAGAPRCAAGGTHPFGLF